MAFFASEIALKPRQRKLVGFFDDFKLKTPDENLAATIKQNDPKQDDRLSMHGAKGEEWGNLDNLIDRQNKQFNRIISAVKRAKIEKDPIDAIIHDRIAGIDVTDGLMRRSNYLRSKGFNMDEFIDSLSNFERAAQGGGRGRKSVSGMSSSHMEPLLKVSIDDHDAEANDRAVDIFDQAQKPNQRAQIFSDSDEDYPTSLEHERKKRKATSINVDKGPTLKYNTQDKPDFREFDSN